MALSRSPVGALLLLTCSSLVATMGLGIPEAAAPVGNQARPRLPDSPPVRCGRAPDLPVLGGQRRQEGGTPGHAASNTTKRPFQWLRVVRMSSLHGGFGGRILLGQ